MSDNFYTILNVDENASQEEIKKAYRKLSLLHHPDKNQGNADAEAKFKGINEAYQVIGDESERKKYDMSRKNPFAGINGNHQQGHNGMSHMDDIFKMFFGRGGGMPGMGNMSGMGNIPGMGGIPGMEHMGGFPAGNIRVFRNGQPVDMNALNKPPPIIKNVFISLEQAYKGDQVPVQIERWLFEDGIRKCENETLYIPIAKGTDDKEMIILRDKGNVMDSNLKGDVKIVITIQNTTIFKREGLNLHMEREITLKDSLCGFDFIINHISGKQLRFNSDAGSPLKDGLVKVIPGFGMERENNKGNLCIKFNVKYPEKLTGEQISRLKEIL
jgi:DnaJ-class molecular chaperone